jgi:hypothetical protein
MDTKATNSDKERFYRVYQTDPKSFDEVMIKTSKEDKISFGNSDNKFVQPSDQTSTIPSDMNSSIFNYRYNNDPAKITKTGRNSPKVPETLSELFGLGDYFKTPKASRKDKVLPDKTLMKMSNSELLNLLNKDDVKGDYRKAVSQAYNSPRSPSGSPAMEQETADFKDMSAIANDPYMTTPEKASLLRRYVGGVQAAYDLLEQLQKNK